MSRPRSSVAVYFASMAATMVAVAALCLALNMVVDPVWYVRGNQLTGVNFAFNERMAKLNRLLPRLQEYDCLIMGSSRSTLLPAQKIQGHRCFNLAFSGGRAHEFVLFARYLRARGFAPVLLIVGVDGFNFLGPPRLPNVPDFVRTGDDPPSMLLTYLSLDALDFSIRTLRKKPPNHRYYDGSFTGRIWPRSHPYRPPSINAPFEDPTDVHPDRAEQYHELRGVFPDARMIGYLPPVSAWLVAQLDRTGDLDRLIVAVHRAARAFDSFYDFAIPSEITWSTTTTYDGSHYSEAVNAGIAAVLDAGAPSQDVDWLHEAPAEISARYHERLNIFLRRLNHDGKTSGSRDDGQPTRDGGLGRLDHPASPQAK